MDNRAEYSLASAGKVQFYASWPKDADPRELRAVGAMLPTLLELWATRLEAKANDAAEAEYASWFTAPQEPPHG